MNKTNTIHSTFFTARTIRFTDKYIDLNSTLFINLVLNPNNGYIIMKERSTNSQVYLEAYESNDPLDGARLSTS
jgi:hypothetical protein